MDIYEKLIENPLFFKWIYYPSEEIQLYWKSYLKQYPNESEKILEFKAQFEKYLKFENPQLSDTSKRELAKLIVKKLDTKDKRFKRIVFARVILKYAAVAILFFTIGSSLVYLYMDSRQPQIFVESSTVPAHAQGPVLIIGDKEQVQLFKGESELDYSGKKEIIVDHEKIFKKESNGQIPEMNTLVIPYGNRSVVTLADGSRVWLNAGSRLIYPSEFVDKTREVLLVGEAFFDVAENKKQPFVVKTTDVNISVLGTRFNVSAYPEDYSIQTVLAEGIVEINRSKSGLFEKGIVLEPGQLAYFNKKKSETRIYKVDADNYTLWTQGLLSFSYTDLSRIVKKLERYYDIRFLFDDPLKGTIQITGKLDVTKDKSEVFEYLSKLTGLEFIEINEKQYTIK